MFYLRCVLNKCPTPREDSMQKCLKPQSLLRFNTRSIVIFPLGSACRVFSAEWTLSQLPSKFLSQERRSKNSPTAFSCPGLHTAPAWASDPKQ